MTRAEFHKIYELTPDDFKAELVGGIVYVASPFGVDHGTNHLPFGSVFLAYEAATPGVQSGDNTTIFLGDDTELQPDLFLRILPEFGGQSQTSEDDFIEGPPELVAEIARSTQALDLHAKRDDYARHGVLEYLVLSLKEQQLKWFDLRANKELSADADGICRIRAFPGLWINADGLLKRNLQQLMATLQQGLQTTQHADFVKRLTAKRK
jgi:Uma2 family endonuclease